MEEYIVKTEVEYDTFDVFIDKYKNDVLETLIENYNFFKNKVEDFDHYVKNVLNVLDSIKINEKSFIKLSYNDFRNMYALYNNIQSQEMNYILEKWKLDFLENMKNKLDTLWNFK